MRPTVAAILSGVLVLSAQQPLPNRTTVKFESNTQLVVEDIIIKDKSGKPVTGLTAADFVVLEDGKPQKVEFVEFQNLEETASPMQLTKRDTEPAVDVQVVPKVTQTQISPGKPGDIKYKDRRLLVMFFDMTSMPLADQVRAVTAAESFVKNQMTKSDLVAIMSFSNDIKVIEDFTDDRDLLIKDIKSLIVGDGQGLAGANADEDASDDAAAFNPDDSEFNIFNTDRQLSALESAVKMLGTLNEKKALVYFASGMQRNGTDNQAQLQSTINAAIRSNVSFYPIDARGLQASAPLGDATRASQGGAGMYTGAAARSGQRNMQNQQETLYTLAADTGGKALLDNNDLSMGLVEAQKDVSSYYILGYYTSNAKLDGRFRSVKITLKDPAMQSRLAKFDYRRGYYAGKEFTKFTSTDKERQLSEALLMGDPMTDLDIAMEVGYFRLAKDRYFVPIVAKIPGSELELAKRGGTESTTIDFIGVIKDATGKQVANVRDFAKFQLKDSTAAQLSKRPINYDSGFTLPPGAYSLRFIARENTTGKIGTFDMKFVVPDLTNEHQRLPISSVILSSQRIQMNEAVYNAEKDKKLLSANPLIEDGRKLIPSVTRVFNRSQELYVYLQAYEPGVEAMQPLVATVSFIRGKVKAFETAPLHITEGLDMKSRAVPLKFSVPLGKLVPGRYTVQVSVLDPAGQKFAFWRAPVVVVPAAVTP
jgi:VWFA-related protein